MYPVDNQHAVIKPVPLRRLDTRDRDCVSATRKSRPLSPRTTKPKTVEGAREEKAPGKSERTISVEFNRSFPCSFRFSLCPHPLLLIVILLPSENVKTKIWLTNNKQQQQQQEGTVTLIKHSLVLTFVPILSGVSGSQNKCMKWIEGTFGFRCWAESHAWCESWPLMLSEATYPAQR